MPGNHFSHARFGTSYEMESAPTIHVPVMPNEVIEWLEPCPGQVIVDGTLGGGGHTRLLAQAVGDSGQIISFDRDARAIAAAEHSLSGLPVQVVQSNFCDIPEVLDQLGRTKVDAVLLDLGLSSDQLADVERGFSFDSTGPLDLRFDVAAGDPAWKLLERLAADPLANIIYQYGEERLSRRIARRIIERRRENPIRTAADLASLVRSCYPHSRGGHRIDPATRTFQALRIAVNDELKSLEIALRRIPDYLRIGGRFAIISFHSLEDRRVKQAFRDDDRMEPLTRKPISASDEEVDSNPRSRSAHLRIACRAPTA